MADALAEQFAVVGPAWLDFERAVRAAGAVGEDLNEQLDSLRGRLVPATLDTAHQLRRQRNALFHDGTLIRDLRGWEAQCRRTIAELRSPARPQRGTASRPSAPRSVPTPTRRVAIVLLTGAMVALAVIAFAWFDAAGSCGAAANRLQCTFDAAGYLTPALQGIAVASIAAASILSRRRRR